MIRESLLLAALLLAAVPATAQPAPPVPLDPAPAAVPAPAPQPALVRVDIQTSEGTIVLALEKDRAPLTTANFLRYVEQKRLDGTSFYRALKVVGAPQFGFIQGGVKGDPKRVLPPVRHEPTSLTGLSHTDGAISMARTAPGTAAGDFFIIAGDLKSFDADASRPGDNLGYAVFGHVVEGMDIVRRILAAPISATAGQGAMKGQMLAAPVRIISARRAR